MGIMLLLTLMLCLQIVANPGIEDVSHDRKSLSEVRQLAERLQADIAKLQSAVSRNGELLKSGVLIDREVLSDQRRQTEADNARMAQNIQDIGLRAKQANETAKTLQDAASKDPAVAQSKALASEAADATRVLQKIQAGSLVTYKRPKGSKTCWLVEVASPKKIRAGRLGEKKKPKTMASYDACLKWITSQTSADFLIVVKPKGWDVKDAWEKTLQQAGVAYAFDVIGEDKDALDDVVGAGY